MNTDLQGLQTIELLQLSRKINNELLKRQISELFNVSFKINDHSIEITGIEMFHSRYDENISDEFSAYGPLLSVDKAKDGGILITFEDDGDCDDAWENIETIRSNLYHTIMHSCH